MSSGRLAKGNACSGGDLRDDPMERVRNRRLRPQQRSLLVAVLRLADRHAARARVQADVRVAVDEEVELAGDVALDYDVPTAGPGGSVRGYRKWSLHPS